jgi:predicted lipoprotein with Yx(FWY)xxD motif
MRLLPKAFASAAVMTFALAACNNSSTTSAGGVPTSSSFSSTGSPVSNGATTVNSTNDAKLGTILVDSDGMTLYLNTQDTPTTSSCTGGCAATWPALTATGSTKAGSGVSSAQLGVAMIGSTDQVTYYGHPLYTYSGDTAAGDTNGQGVGGIWYAVSTKGTPAKGSSGGGGYSRSGY